MVEYKAIAEAESSTVLAAYEPVKTRPGSYQSEAALEAEFLRLLQEQGYEYREFHRE